MSPDAAVVEAARRFHLVVTTAQLADAGLSRKAIEGRLRRGWLTRVFHGVYRVGPVDSRWTREAGALLACGVKAVLSHATAAAIWGMRARVDGPIVVTVARGNRVGPRGVTVHRSTLTRGEVRQRDGLRITSPERTLHDLAQTLDPDDLDRTVNEALVLGLTTPQRLHSYLARSSHRHGAKALERALRREHGVSKSELQRAMRALIEKLGLPRPQTEVMVEGHLVDFVWHEQRLIVETDGHAPHRTPRRFETDRARDAHLTACGYRVLRFTWRQLTEEPEIVAARLAAALALAGTAAA